MTKVGAYVMIRFMFTVFQPNFSIEIIPMTAILGWMAVAAILFGCILALAQSDLKRILSYILIAEVGYIVLGISLANRYGLTGAILHILNDAFMMACLFFVAGALMHTVGTRDIYHLKFLHRKMPYTMAALTIGGLSVIGIPPTCGFFSKWYLVLGAIEAQQWVFAITLLSSSLLTAIIFFRIIGIIYFESPVPLYLFSGETGHAAGKGEHPEEKHGEIMRAEPPLSMLIPILITAGGILVLGFLSGKIISSVIQYAIPSSF
jgi:multicomponent Na+:H+ antiporter subunit D